MDDHLTRMFTPLIDAMKMFITVVSIALLVGCSISMKNTESQQDPHTGNSVPISGILPLSSRDITDKAVIEDPSFNLLAGIQQRLINITSHAVAGDQKAQLALGKIYWRVRHYHRALMLLTPLAKDGDAEAQYYVGYAYYAGLGVIKNHLIARDWLQQAAKRNYEQALTILAVLDVQKNRASPINITKVVQPSIKQRKAKKNVSARAINKEIVNTPIFYSVCDADVEYALKQLQHAAEKGTPSAQFALSVLYLEGKQIPQNIPLAIKWVTQAASQGYPAAQNNLGAAYTHGNGIEKDFKQAFYWYEKAAKQGYPLAQYNLAMAYLLGNGVQQDHSMAYLWFSILNKSKQGGILITEQGKNIEHTLKQVLLNLTQRLERTHSLSKAQAMVEAYYNRANKS